MCEINLHMCKNYPDRKFHLFADLIFTVSMSTTINITGISEYPPIHNPDSNPPILWIDRRVKRFMGEFVKR